VARVTWARNAVTLMVCLGEMCLVGSSAVAPPASDVIQASGSANSQTAPSEPAVKPSKTQSEQVEKKEEHTPQNVTARAWKILEEAGADNDVSKRTEAVSALAVVGSKPRAFALVESALQDKDPAVRRVAVIALGEMKSRKSLPKLRQMLEDDAPEVSFAAAQALWQMGDRSGRQVLFEVLAGERNPSGGGLGRKVGEIKKKLHSPSALAEIGVKQGARALLGPFAIGLTVAEELRKDNSASARALSAALLATDRNPESAEQLEQALDDKNWLVRATAAKSLAKRRHRHALPRLEALLSDDKEVVRYSAAASVLALT
jgi:HEAT repeat protein